MDWGNILGDAGVIAAASAAIFFVIDFIKKLYHKLPWKWVQKTPGEVWFALSMVFGIGIALALFWDNFFGTGATLSSGAASAAYGLVSGAGSKFINSLASSSGARLKAAKEEAIAKTTNMKKDVPKTTDVLLEEFVQTPACVGITTSVEEARVMEFSPSAPIVEIVKKVTSKGDYVIIDGTVYKLTKGE